LASALCIAGKLVYGSYLERVEPTPSFSLDAIQPPEPSRPGARFAENCWNRHAAGRPVETEIIMAIIDIAE
jgi:hypothetical protein